MTIALPIPDETPASLEAARGDMERRAARRQEVEQHLQSCRICTDVLCPAGVELVREALR